MKLKKLIVHGFKSFRDRTTIHFDQGITGIVGPNGCGKSNIVDALFWVMGEMSAKHLRGNNMKDVIFAGSEKYSPSSWAEVTLVLENTEGKHIHIGNRVANPSEIQLTRKLYRNSETEYRINNDPCRLKDIQEVFMDTGAGAKSYSIIAQGEIARLVQAKPVERRIIVEEVAGVTKFNLRKKESKRKIEQTKSNLERLHDLQMEIEKNINILRDQAENAQRAKNLKEKIKKGELVTSSHKVFELLKDYSEKTERKAELIKSLEDSSLAKDQLDLSLQKERVEKDEKLKKLDEFQGLYNEQSKKLAAAEERLHHLMQSLTEKENRQEKLQDELASNKQDCEQRKKRLDELKETEKDILNTENKKEELDILDEKIKTLENGLEDNKAKVEEVEKELKLKRDEVFNLDQEIFKTNSKLEEYSNSLQDLNIEIEELEVVFSAANTDITEARDNLNEKERELKELTQKEEKIKKSLSSLKEDFLAEETEFKKDLSQWTSLKSKLESLNELIESLEGIKDGTADFLKSSEGQEYSLVGSVLKCDHQYEKAMNTLVYDLLEMAFSQSSVAPFEWMRANKDNGLDVLVQTSTLRNSLDEIGLIPLIEIVKIDEKHKETLSPLLTGRYIFDVQSDQVDESTINKIKELDFDVIVTIDGALLIENKNGALAIRSNLKNESVGNIIERNNRSEELSKEVSKLRTLLDDKEKVLEDLSLKIEHENDLYESTRKSLNEFKVQYAARKAALDEKVNSKKEGGSRLSILKSRRDEISKSKVTRLEENEEKLKLKQDLSDSLEEYNKKYQTEKEELKLIESSYHENKNLFFELNFEFNSYLDKLKANQDQIVDVEGQVKRLDEKTESNEKEIKELVESVEKLTNDCEELEKKNLEEAKDLEDKSDALSLIKEELNVLGQAMEGREKELRDINKNILKNEKEKDQIDVRTDKIIGDEAEITRNIFEKYQIDLRDVIGEELKLSQDLLSDLLNLDSMYTIETEQGTSQIFKQSYEFVRRYGQDLKDVESKTKKYKTELNKFGEINWKAVEDYERQKLRFEFLKEQEIELKNSLEDLEKAIEHIDNNSKVRFKQAFDEVNERFKKVFPIIFGGGNASLQVIGDLDDSECGVDIIAQPPGKKMQNINLMSGGEKALTALSLIFSVFLVKPSPFCLLDEVDAPLDDANVGRFNDLLREMSYDSQFILITHNKKTMELNDVLYGVTMQEPGISSAVSVQLQ
ncbi:MAG: chromosome segregation protein SMC [Bacteriovoracaceae bacterium]